MCYDTAIRALRKIFRATKNPSNLPIVYNCSLVFQKKKQKEKSNEKEKKKKNVRY